MVSFIPLFVDDDAATTDYCRRILVISYSKLVVVDYSTISLVKDLDSELVCSAATRYLSINSREHEAIITRAVDCA